MTKKNSRSTIGSVKWNAINNLVSQGTTFVAGILLMRLLSPEAFGLLGMITVFTGFLNILKDSGLSSSLIYEKNLKSIDKDTVFWFNIIVGTFLSLTFYFSAGIISTYYEEPLLRPLVKVFSLTFVISSFSNIQYGLLKKNLEFKKIFLAEITGLLLSTSAAVYFAYIGLGVWALIVLHLSRTLLIAVSLWVVSNYKPTLQFSLEVLKKHFRYSFPVLGTKSFNYWTRNADNFFIGKFLGSEALGFYSRAFFFVTLPMQRISSVISNVLFPSMSLYRDDKKKISALYLKSMRITSFITFPLTGGLIIFAEPFVGTLFGAKWLPIVVCLKILTVMSMFESVFVFSTSVYYARGATALNFKLSSLMGIVNIIVFYIGSQYSIEMVALLLVLAYFIMIIPKLYYCCTLIDINMLGIVRNLAPTFLSNIASMSICYFLLLTLPNGISQYWILIVGIIVYAILFITLNLLFNVKDSKEFLGYGRKLIKA